MLTPEHWSMSPTEEDDVCYTDLQPVIDMASLITSSTDPCLALFPDEGYCVEYTVCTEETSPDFQADCAVYNLPDSPQSLDEEECTILSPDMLQTRLYEDSQVYEDEDDDASVMLDLMDLSFLDEPDMSSEEQDYGRLSFTDSLDTCPTVVVGAARTCCSQFHHHPITPSPSPPATSPSPSCPSPSSSSSPSSSRTGTPTVPPSPPTTTTTTATVAHFPTTHISSLPSSSSSSSTTFTFHYVDQPPTTITTIVGSPGPSPTSNDDDDDDQSLLRSPVPTAASIRSALAKRVRGGRKEQQQQQQQRQQSQQTEERETSGGENNSAGASSMDFDTFDNSDHESDDFKPYCGSRRGAKKNLLWKFLLWTLDNHSDVVSWTDVHQGVFKFVDTGRASTLWGERKKKQGMTFEKLSRGIRHYYKLGLMERLPHTRLMYKFNWDKVPRKYRKA